MFSRRNFLQLTSSVGAGASLPELSDAVKTAVVDGIGRIVKASKLLSSDNVYCLSLDFETVISGVGDPKFSIYVGSALRSAAMALKSTPCLAIPFVDLYSRPHSDSILGSLSNRDPNWPANKIAEIADPPQFMLSFKIPGHYNYVSKCLKKYGVLANPQTVERYIELHNKYRSSLELALQSPEIANWLCQCTQDDVLSELHRMFGVHRRVSSFVKQLNTLLPDAKCDPLLRDFADKLIKGQYNKIIDDPLILACDRLTNFSMDGIRQNFLLHSMSQDDRLLLQQDPHRWSKQRLAQLEQVQTARQDQDYLAKHGIELEPEDSLARQLDQCGQTIEEVSKSIRKQEQELEAYSPNGRVTTIRNSIIVSEVGAKPLKYKFNRTKSGYWIDKNGVYLVLPRVNRKTL